MSAVQGWLVVALLAVLVALRFVPEPRTSWVYKTELGAAAKATIAGREGWEVVAATHVGGPSSYHVPKSIEMP